AMQASLNRRFSGGVHINANYTWSKNMGIAGLGGSDDQPEIRAVQFYNLNRSLADIHVPHRFNLSTIFELPFGQGKPWLSDGAAAAIFGGWQLNTVLYAHSGSPFDIEASGDSLDLPGSQQRADQVKPFKVLGGIGRDNPWFDPTSFVEVTEPRFGNVGFNTFLGPSQFNMDVGIFRKFQISENVDLQFRAEAFNFTNTPHFRNPRSNVSSSRFGVVDRIRNVGREGIDQRIFRFGLRLGF
ncbi:MAG: hypothetical protein ACRD1R_01910, partial [Acidobacteriota bacterium]